MVARHPDIASRRIQPFHHGRAVVDCGRERSLREVAAVDPQIRFDAFGDSGDLEQSRTLFVPDCSVDVGCLKDRKSFRRSNQSRMKHAGKNNQQENGENLVQC